MCVEGVSAVNRSTAWVVGATHDGNGTILRTRNSGKKWVRQGSVGEIPNVGFEAVSAVSPSTAWVVGDNGVILKTKNGGATWEQQAMDIVPKIAYQDVFALDKYHVWASDSDAGTSNKAFIVHTRNGGKTWAKQGEGVIPSDVEGLLGIFAVNQDIVWTIGRHGCVMVSTEGGQTWDVKEQTGFFDNNLVVAIDDKIAWMAVDDNNVLYTVDGGDNWNEQIISNDGDGSENMMGITAFDKNELWVVSLVTDGAGGIYHTTDGGQDWLSQINPVVANYKRVFFAGALR